jgi:hypothetical protein
VLAASIIRAIALYHTTRRNNPETIKQAAVRTSNITGEIDVQLFFYVKNNLNISFKNVNYGMEINYLQIFRKTIFLTLKITNMKMEQNFEVVSKNFDVLEVWTAE